MYHRDLSFPTGNLQTHETMSLPQPASRRGFWTVPCLLATGILLALATPSPGASNQPLRCNPANLAFGNVQLGSSRTLSAAVTNTGASSVTISTEATTGPGFSTDGIILPLTLEAGQSFTFRVTFAPQSVDSATGSITATGPEDATLTIPLMGTGTSAGRLISSPQTINFGNVVLGSTAQQTATLAALGGGVTVYSATSSSSEFASSGLFFPLILAAGQSVSYRVAFSPQSSGKASAVLSFNSSAANFQADESLDGDGVPPESYIVSLNWQPSSSQVVGYNVYRGNAADGPYLKINSTLDPDTAYTDNGVPGGQTYYYVTTAVNSSGQESGYSNRAKVIVP